MELPPGLESLRASDPASIGRYRVLGRLGGGGMGTVYLAASATAPDPPLVAVKVMRADLARDPDFRRQFAQETELARRVRRFCTAEVLDADTAGEQPYLVTEYVPGPTLASLVAERGPLAEAEQERLAVAVATALVTIHAAGLAHRDLKPDNIIMSASGPRVIDFGVAHPLDTDTLTTLGLGTPAYMAPEQIRGHRAAAAADIHAFGAVLIWAATGRLPFGAVGGEDLSRRILRESPDVSGLPPLLAGLAAAAMAKDPARRPPAWDLLHRLIAGVPPTARLPEQRAPTRRAVLTAAGALGAAALTAGGVAAAWPRPRRGTEVVARPNLPALYGAPISDFTDTVYGVAFAPVGAVLATASAEGVVRLWDVRAPARPALLGSPLTRSGGPVAAGDGAALAAVFTPDAAYLAVVGDFGWASLWSVGRAAEHRVVADNLPGFSRAAVKAAAFRPRGAGTVLATAGADGAVRLWDLTDVLAGTGPATGQVALARPPRRANPVHAVAFSPDGRTLAAGRGDGTVVLIDTSAADDPGVLASPVPAHGAATRSVAFSPSGVLLATGGSDGVVRLWDVTDRARPRALARARHAPSPEVPLDRAGAHVQAVAFSPDGATLASANYDGTVTLWEVRDPGAPKPRASLVGHTGWAYSVAFSPGGDTLASAGSDRAVRLWRLA